MEFMVGGRNSRWGIGRQLGRVGPRSGRGREAVRQRGSERVRESRESVRERVSVWVGGQGLATRAGEEEQE